MDVEFMKMLYNKCDIWHLQITSESPGWGVPPEEKYSYNIDPDLTDIPCLLHIDNQGINNMYNSISQQEPMSTFQAQIKIELPPDTDIRTNDKLIEKENGYEYLVGIYEKIFDETRGREVHHKIAFLRRENLKEAI